MIPTFAVIGIPVIIVVVGESNRRHEPTSKKEPTMRKDTIARILPWIMLTILWVGVFIVANTELRL